MRNLTKAILLFAIATSVLSVKLRQRNEASPPPQETPEQIKNKQAAYQAELRKFIAESNKVKVIKWGDYDVYINQNCPQPPTQPQFQDNPQNSPIKNCMEASVDAELIAKEVAKITAEGATQGVPVKNSVKECFEELTTATTLRLKPSTTKECYEKSFEEHFRNHFSSLRQKLEQEGWKYNENTQLFEKNGVAPPVAVADPSGAFGHQRGTIGM